MASLSTDGRGNRTIQFVAADKKRRSIRLGKVSKKVAESIKIKVEELNAAQIAKVPLDTETTAWVAGIGDDLAAKLAAVGLIPERQSQTLGAFLGDYLARRAGDSKPATLLNLRQVITDLTQHFGPTCPLRDVTEQQADGFRTHYLTRTPKLAPATVSRRLKTVKLFFAHARRMKLIPANPFADITAPGTIPEGRKYYIRPGDAQRLIAAANPVWRVIVALTRFGGLRCPSEVLSLQWEHINFETGRMTIPSPKTEHHPGKAYRVAPLFPALRPYLDEAWELAAPGEVYVVGGPQGAGYRAAAQGPDGWKNANLRSTFKKLIRRAGLTPWPRLFHNLRASCETDLMQSFPLHVVCSWLGNTPVVAMKHYLQVRDEDFQKALQGGAESGAVVVQNPVQSGAANKGQERKGETVPSEVVGVRAPQSLSDLFRPHSLLGLEGVEPS